MGGGGTNNGRILKEMLTSGVRVSEPSGMGVVKRASQLHQTAGCQYFA